jgi:hypothetical protein
MAVLQGGQMICVVTPPVAAASGQQMVVPPLHRLQAQAVVQISMPSSQRPQEMLSPGVQTPWPVQAAGSVGHWQLVPQ